MLKNLTRSVALAASLAVAGTGAAAGFSAIRGADETPDPATVTAVEAGGAAELRTGAERLISTEAGGEVGDRGAISAADLPVGFHKILAEKNGRTDALRFFVLPPPPGKMPATGVRTEFSPTKKAELFTVLRADIDTLSQISVKFKKVVDPAALAETGTFALTDLDFEEKSVTDAPEITGAAWDPEAGILTLGVRGMTAQPGETFGLAIRGEPTVRLVQPDEKWLDFKLAELENLALAAEENARAAAASEPEILSGAVVETPNQIRLPVPADLPASGIGLAENWFLPDGADFRGANGDGADVILAVAGLPTASGAAIEIGFGTGAGALHWPAVIPDFSTLGVAVVETGSGETASGAELFVDEIRPAVGTGETVEIAGSGAAVGTGSGEILAGSGATGTGEISEKSGTGVAAGTGETAPTGSGATAENPAAGSGAEALIPAGSGSEIFEKSGDAGTGEETAEPTTASGENLIEENSAENPAQNSVVSSEVEKPAGDSGKVSPRGGSAALVETTGGGENSAAPAAEKISPAAPAEPSTPADENSEPVPAANPETPAERAPTPAETPVAPAEAGSGSDSGDLSTIPAAQ